MKPVLNIAIIGEGKNDVGIMGEKMWQDGTVQAYLERFFADNFELKFTPLSVSKKETSEIKSLKGGYYRKFHVKGVAKKIFRFLQKYPHNDFDLLILFSDTDKTQGQKASEKEAKNKYQSILEHLEEGGKLLDEVMPDLEFIPMIPVRILECWLLGDKDGFENIGCSPQNPNLPKQPELIWGDAENPDSNYPKHYLKRIIENGGFADDTETYRNIVFNNNFENSYQNCPISFPLFYDKMKMFKERFIEKQ
jgi:hypothetical protein